MQRHLPYMSISPSWYHMCRQHAKSLALLFSFIVLLLLVFGILFCGLLDGLLLVLIPFFDILASLLVGHPFGGTKKSIWLALLHAFFWSLLG